MLLLIFTIFIRIERMMNMLKKRVLSVLLAAAMLPICGSYTGVVKVPSAVAAEDSEAAQTRPMTLDDVRALSTKGEGLRWSDFDEFEGEPFFIGKVKYCTFIMDDGYGLSVQGEPDKELVKAHLFRYVYDPGYPKIDIRRDDVESFIEQMTTQTLGTQSALKTTTSKTTTSTATTSKNTTTTTAVTTSSAEVTSTSTKKTMNMDEVRKLAKKGMDLTWEDLAPYGCKTTGDGIHSAAHDFYFGDGYCFSVCGQPPVKLQTVELFYKDRSNSIDIRTGDIDLFIRQNTAEEVPDIGCTFDEIRAMSTEQVEELFAARGLTDKDFYQVYCQDYTPEDAVDHGIMRCSIMLKPDNYMINLTKGELVTKTSSLKEARMLPRETDFAWKTATVLKSLGLPEDLFSVYVNTENMVGRFEPSGEYTYGIYCDCYLDCYEYDPVKCANLVGAAMNYAQLNPDFAFIRSDISGAGSAPIKDSRFSIEEHCVQFNETVDAAWVLTNYSYDEGSMDKNYKFYPSDGGKYLLLTLDYSADVSELADQPDMPGVDCTMQSYIIECRDGRIRVIPDKEYTFPYPETEEEIQASLAQKEAIFAKAFELMDSDHFFQCIRLRGVDNGLTNIMHIRSSSDGKVFVSREDTEGTVELLPAAEDKEAGTKRFAVNGSYMIGDERDYSKPETEIRISKTDNDNIITYDVEESVGVLMPTTLKMRCYKKGDVSGDKSFNVADIVLLQRWLLGKKPENFKNWKAADLNGDDVIDVFDLTAAKRYLVETM